MTLTSLTLETLHPTTGELTFLHVHIYQKNANYILPQDTAVYYIHTEIAKNQKIDNTKCW